MHLIEFERPPACGPKVADALQLLRLQPTVRKGGGRAPEPLVRIVRPVKLIRQRAREWHLRHATHDLAAGPVEIGGKKVLQAARRRCTNQLAPEGALRRIFCEVEQRRVQQAALEGALTRSVKGARAWRSGSPWTTVRGTQAIARKRDVRCLRLW